MRQARVLYKGDTAGLITQHDDGTFLFQYAQEWLKDSTKPPISLSIPKRESAYKSEYLFPFFFHLLPEGSNREVVCINLRIDRYDDFGLLLQTARTDTIGAVTIEKIAQPV